MERKPLAFAASRDAKSIRYAAAEWQVFVDAAVLRDVDPSTLARECSLIGINVLSSPTLMEAYVRLLSGVQRPDAVGRASHTNGNGGKA
jgi:hypothetical protein